MATALNRVRVLGMHFVPVPPEKFGAEGLPPLPMVSFEEMPMKNGVPEVRSVAFPQMTAAPHCSRVGAVL